MGDFLFSCTGRLPRLGYYLTFAFMAAVVFGVMMLQQSLAGWKFGNILVGAVAVLPLAMYIAAVSKRFEDLDTHPIAGFLKFYLLPLLLVILVAWVLGQLSEIRDGNFFRFELAYFSSGLAPEVIATWAALGVSGLTIAYGQLKLFLWPGTKGPNEFGERPKYPFSITRPATNP